MMTDPEPEAQAPRNLGREKIQAALRSYDWRAKSARPITEHQVRRVEYLVGTGRAAPLPPHAQHCTSMIELKRLLDGATRYYVTAAGDVFAGNTFAQARRVEL